MDHVASRHRPQVSRYQASLCRADNGDLWIGWSAHRGRLGCRHRTRNCPRLHHFRFERDKDALLGERLFEGPRISHDQNFPTINGWVFHWDSDQPPAVAERSQPIWSDERGLTISRLGSDASKRFRLSFGSDISMDVDLLQRRVSNSSRRDFAPADAHHFLADQVYPRILAQEGAFILHGGSFILNNAAVLLLGPSGRGKSTLIASFAQSGFVAMGDDACSISSDTGTTMAESLYPSMRLLHDSLAAVFKGAVQTAPVGSHTAKRRVATPPYAEPRKIRVAAIFSIAEAVADGVTVRPQSIASACMTCVENSFTLNPSDSAQAAGRLEHASHLARAVPFFEIAYPRDYARLPEVRAAILDQVAALQPA